MARHPLPGQGAREQSAGITLARRVPTTTEGGGGPPWCGGGGGACGGGWGHLRTSPWSPPPSRGGRVTRPVRSGYGGGGGWGGDLGVGKAHPVPRTVPALPKHPAEVAVPRVRPWRGRGRWPVFLDFYGGKGRPGSCGLPAPSHLCWSCVVAASSPVVRARARVGHRGGRAQRREHKSTNMGSLSLACCVRFRCCSLVPVPVPCVREAARHSRRGVAARAGRMGSGGRPGRTWRHAGAGPVAVAGGRGRSSRGSAVALSVPHSGVGARVGGERVLQAMLRRAGAQVRRRARCGPLCGPRDLRCAGCVAWGLRPGPGAWVAAGGRVGAGALAVAGRRGRPSRRSAEAPRAPHRGVRGRAGGECAVQAKLWGAHVQGCRRARRGPPEGRGTRGWQGALPGGRGRGRARG